MVTFRGRRRGYPSSVNLLKKLNLNYHSIKLSLTRAAEFFLPKIGFVYFAINNQIWRGITAIVCHLEMKAALLLTCALAIAGFVRCTEALPGPKFRCKPGQEFFFMDCNKCICDSYRAIAMCSKTYCMSTESQLPCEDEEKKPNKYGTDDCTCAEGAWYCDTVADVEYIN